MTDTTKEAMRLALDALEISMAEMDSAIAALRQAIELDGWRPIETAPKDGTRILAFIDWWDGPESNTGRFKNGRFWPDYRDATSKMPTHWRSLPDAPKD